MKYSFVAIFICSFFLSTNLTAQTVNYCGIWFDYDQAGNRVKRYEDCKDVNSGVVTLPPPNARLIKSGTEEGSPTVSPNPMNGTYTIRMKKDEGMVRFDWYDAKGAVVASGSFEGIEYTGSIGAFPPGEYLLKISVYRNINIFKITKRS